ncbi:MerR family transcriptional regulator [Acinetobacter qingfengensis]|uniref:MerR family transcriptional regulator n=1 Tax=Acinetobacter qingfengensis TaxID=1262585 RepID=A0A1E7R2Z7_9GAMM|nr:chaperone modulator CbpM [Acinetobacter qingfengensis]KAA8733759.1 MerR family transcriptional regulator [Acinetobacter qingfengensis]OEY93729.1 MerR family transcriptional regulator [Acinetobacter qingfengensis]
MKKFTIHEITIHDPCHSEIIEQHQGLNFVQFVQAVGVDDDWVLQLFEYDILSSTQNSPQQYRFVSEDLARARRAYRLQRDFDASFAAVAVMLDLIDEVQHLRKRIG